MRGEGKRRRRRDWIALSTDICRDPDVLALTIEQRWVWIALLAHAGRVGPEFEISASTARSLFALRPGWRAEIDLKALAQHGFIALELSVEPGFEPQKPAKPAKKPAKPKAKEPDPEYPKGLNVAAWKQYEQYRRDNNLRKYKPKYAKSAMNKWAKFPATVQQLAVNHTIESGWQGVFPEKFAKGHQVLTPEQEDARRRGEIASLARLMQIQQNPGESWDDFAARVLKANDRRIAAHNKR